ncbi:MAG TPA: hypothetical protein VK395_10780 [Gemmataceae bacterium]|nr:hypothetical protein [Gemmataceae bacterium]
MKYLLLFGTVLALALPARAAEVDKYLPNDTAIVAAVNVKQIVESPLIKKYALPHLQDALKKDDETSKILNAVGFDPTKDLTSLTISFDGVSSEPKVAVIVHGQFDVDKLAAKAEEEAKNKPDKLVIHKEADGKVYEITAPDGKPGFVAIIDKTTIIFSNQKEYVNDALAKAAGKKKSDVSKELRTAIEKQDANQSLWAIIPGETLKKSEFINVAEEKAKKNIEKIENIVLGITVSKDVKFKVDIATKSADSAKELAEDLKEALNQAKGFLALVAGQQKNIGPIVDLVGAMKLATDGSSITIKSEVSQELIEKGLKRE